MCGVQASKGQAKHRNNPASLNTQPFLAGEKKESVSMNVKIELVEMIAVRMWRLKQGPPLPQ